MSSQPERRCYQRTSEVSKWSTGGILEMIACQDQDQIRILKKSDKRLNPGPFTCSTTELHPLQNSPKASYYLLHVNNSAIYREVWGNAHPVMNHCGKESSKQEWRSWGLNHRPSTCKACTVLLLTWCLKSSQSACIFMQIDYIVRLC